jgi:hypothetical protein
VANRGEHRAGGRGPVNVIEKSSVSALDQEKATVFGVLEFAWFNTYRARNSPDGASAKLPTILILVFAGVIWLAKRPKGPLKQVSH